MLKVSLTGSLQAAANGAEVIEINARNIRELMRKIVEQYPKMGTLIDDNIAVSINGEIYRDNRDVPIAEDTEVFLIPRIQGG